jgi:hypothetical protein
MNKGKGKQPPTAQYRAVVELRRSNVARPVPGRKLSKLPRRETKISMRRGGW